MFITTSLKGSRTYEAAAKEVANVLHIPFKERHKQTLEELGAQSPYYMMYSSRGPILVNSQGEEHAFHLSMAHLRLLAIERQEGDHLVRAIHRLLDESIKPFIFLDATFGLGSDSIVTAFAFQEQVRIEALEGKKELAFIGNYGLRHFVHKNPLVTRALRSIHLVHMNYEDYFSYCDDNSIDIIYFDPMFEHPVQESPQFKALRGYTDESPLEKSAFIEACRIAKKGIIVKERSHSRIFEKLGIQEMIGGTYSRIRYGLYRT